MESTIQNRRFEVLQEASERYSERRRERESALERLDKVGLISANTPERIGRRIARKRMNLRATGAAAVPAEQMLADERGLERIIGANNLVGISYFDRAVRAAGTVARIIVRDGYGQVQGFGTGFLVSPRLLLTNQHVLEDSGVARHSLAEFNYEDDEFGRRETSVRFELDPGTFFKASPYEELDYALVAVKDRSEDGTRLARFGWNRLIGALGKAVVGEPLNVIQHPEGEPKQLALRENLLLDILEDPPHFLHYGADTLQGSSGSPVLNDEWEVVALHHRGVAKTRNGQVLRRDGTPATSDPPDTEIDWIANEGVRTSAIVGDLRARTDYRSEERALVDELLNGGASPVERVNGTHGTNGRASDEGTDVTVLRDGRLVRRFQVEFSLGFPDKASAAEPRDGEPELPPTSSGPLPSGLVVEEKTLALAHYAKRKGYDAAFLGAKHAVPLPDPGGWTKDLAPVKGASKDAPYLLRYTNFSVAVSKSRRLPVFTVVNIDGKQSQNLKRGTDVWYIDPRIDAKHQVGNELYKNNPLDRGHMVRRLDPVWGGQATLANEDTFHYTNACPQHANLNQKTWNDLGLHPRQRGHAQHRGQRLHGAGAARRRPLVPHGQAAARVLEGRRDGAQVDRQAVGDRLHAEPGEDDRRPDRGLRVRAVPDLPGARPAHREPDRARLRRPADLRSAGLGLGRGSAGSLRGGRAAGDGRAPRARGARLGALSREPGELGWFLHERP